jgi:hypothetical protein
VETQVDDDDNDDDCSLGVPQAATFTDATLFVEADGFGDASSPCNTYSCNCLFISQLYLKQIRPSDEEYIRGLKGEILQFLQMFSVLSGATTLIQTLLNKPATLCYWFVCMIYNKSIVLLRVK